MSQQLASADSVCANIEEGFLIIARGSLRETQARNRRLRHWIPPEIAEKPIALAEEIHRIFSATIAKLFTRH